MAEKKTIEINVETNAKEAADGFDDLSGSIKDATKKTELLNNSVKETKDAANSAESGFKKVATAAKGVGTALKAAGIGLIIGAFSALKSAFEQNQEVATTFSAVMETISIVFNQTVGAVIAAAKASYEATGGFNALGKVMGGLLNLVLAPLKLTFYSLKLGIQELQLVWEQSFFGDKDPKVIKDLRKNIKATEKDIVDVGKSVVKSGKDIYNNFGEAVSEVVDLGKRGIAEVSKISISAAYEQGKALVNAKNAAAIAAAQQGILIEKYDMQAEKLRQIRDEERNSISERIKANNDLKEVLDNQEKAMLSQASLQIQAAQLEYNKAKTTENRVALLEAEANRVGVLAQIEGLRSEQLANDLALQRESDELTKTRTESEVTLALEREKATNELIKDEEKKIQAQIDTANKEKALQLARLQEQVDLYKEGTQGRLDAEIAYNEKKQEIDLQIMTYEDQLLVKKQEKQKAADEKAIADAKETADKEIAIAKAVAEAKTAFQNQNLDVALQGVQLIAGIFEKSKKVQKAAVIAESAIGIGKIVIATQTANAADTAAAALMGPAGIPYLAGKLVSNKISAGFGIAANIVATSKALKALGGGGAPSGGGAGGGAGGGGGSGSAPMSASFNVVGNSGINQLGQLQQKPTKAYVVSGDVTTAQSLDRNRVENATLVQ
jgi:hypothetical protein